MTDPAPECQHSDKCLDEEQMQQFVHQASLMISAEDQMLGHLCVLVSAPFDRSAQREAAAFLASPELSAATEVARRIGDR